MSDVVQSYYVCVSADTIIPDFIEGRIGIEGGRGLFYIPEKGFESAFVTNIKFHGPRSVLLKFASENMAQELCDLINELDGEDLQVKFVAPNNIKKSTFQ